MIRITTPADDPVLVRFGRNFYDSMDYKDVPYCEESAARWMALIREKGSLLLAEIDGYPVGMAAALFSPFIFNDQFTVGAELFWWIEPEYRSYGIGKELLAELESAAHNAGCVRFTMISVADHERLGKIYGQAGYTEAERSYVKRP